MPFIEAFARLNICTWLPFCWNLVKPVILVQCTAVVNNSPHAAIVLQTSSSFPLRLSESQGMYNLGQICHDSETKL